MMREKGKNIICEETVDLLNGMFGVLKASETKKTSITKKKTAGTRKKVLKK